MWVVVRANELIWRIEPAFSFFGDGAIFFHSSSHDLETITLLFK